MGHPEQPLRVNPDDLHVAADQLEASAQEFRVEHDASQTQAGQVSLGSGADAAAVPELLAAWQMDGTRFSARFAAFAATHRLAATAFQHTGDDGAGS